MPNLVPPITTVEKADEYRERIMSATKGFFFEPLMTLYLTDKTSELTVQGANRNPHIYGFKLYPAGATTNSDSGVTDIFKRYDVFGHMERLGVPLLVHGEVTDSNIDIFDREEVFLDRYLVEIHNAFPALKIVLEHITTKQGVQFVLNNENVYGTITPHHLLLNRNDLFQGGVCPHHYCLPIVKAEDHRQALVKAVLSGSPKLFLGTDSAPHSVALKQSECGCAGIYNPYSIEILAQFFDEHGKLELFEPFVSQYGADFYGLSQSEATLTLVKEPWVVPATTGTGDDETSPIWLRPFKAMEEIKWRYKW